MRPLRPFSSGAFRFAMLLAAGFAAGALALLLVVAHAMDHYVADGVADAVGTETDILRDEDREQGPEALLRAVERHERAVHEAQFRYALIDADGRRLAGTLPIGPAQPGWHHLRIPPTPEEDPGGVNVLAQEVAVSQGRRLVVAADLFDLRHLQGQILRFTALSGVLITLLALLGGAWVGSVFLRRLDAANGAIARIMRGDLSERLPTIGPSPEFRELTINLNAMLERIENLVVGVRQMSVDVAHDLRTPLTRLRHRLEAIEAQAGQPGALAADLRPQVEASLAQIDELIRIFASLLRLGALESGAARAHFARVDLSALAEQVGAAYAPAIEDEGRSLSLAVAPGLAMTGDRDLIVQAMTNLLENATRHTPPGSRIALRLEREGANARLVVEDNGPGVPEADREKVLRRFFRVERSRTTAGSGLGLALVAAIVQLHDGRIALADARPGLRVALAFPALAP